MILRLSNRCFSHTIDFKQHTRLLFFTCLIEVGGCLTVNGKWEIREGSVAIYEEAQPEGKVTSIHSLDDWSDPDTGKHYSHSFQINTYMPSDTFRMLAEYDDHKNSATLYVGGLVKTPNTKMTHGSPDGSIIEWDVENGGDVEYADSVSIVLQSKNRSR